VTCHRRYCDAYAVLDSGPAACEELRGHDGPHRMLDFRAEDDAFVTVEWFDDQEPCPAGGMGGASGFGIDLGSPKPKVHPSDSTSGAPFPPDQPVCQGNGTEIED
jgi:hypothetical protein